MKRMALICSILGLGINLAACGVAGDDFVNTDNTETESTVEKEEIKTESAKDTTEEDVDVQIVENEVSHSDEFNEAFEKGDRCGANFIADGDAEVTEFDSWQEGYKQLIEDIESSEGGTYSLIYVDEDDIPELIYEVKDGGACIATFADGYVNIFSSNTLKDIEYVENGNALFATERVQSTYYDYVVAIKDGYWVSIAYGERAPFDEWAEDSFDENGEPIISSWILNEEEISSEKKYDEAIGKFINLASTKKVVCSDDADSIISKIQENE